MAIGLALRRKLPHLWAFSSIGWVISALAFNPIAAAHCHLKLQRLGRAAE
jgi:hypothetical protein